MFTGNEELERSSRISKCEGQAMVNETLGKGSYMKVKEVRRDGVVEVQRNKPISWPSNLLPCLEEPVVRQVQQRVRVEITFSNPSWPLAKHLILLFAFQRISWLTLRSDS